MRVLLTGFEPFGGSAINPSEQVVKALTSARLAPTHFRALEIYPAILPVAHLAGPQALAAAFERVEPEAVVCLGEAPRRPLVSLERLAVNLLDFTIPDNAGAQVMDQPVRAGGPAAYFATLPLRSMLERIRAAGVPVELSLSAGSYLCNQVLYSVLDLIAARGLAVPAGFIHLPSLPEQAAERGAAAPSMALETSLKAVQAALLCLAEMPARLERETTNP